MAGLPADVAVIGGGRWARQHATALLDVLSESTRLHVVSEAHPAAWVQFRDELPPGLRSRLILRPGLDEICTGADIGMAVVARSARDHADTAIRLLQCGRNVLVEKPFALNLPDAERVIETAGSSRCAVSLPFLHASYFDRFLEAASGPGSRKRIRIVWHDGSGEVRHGSTQRFDPSVNVVLDVFAHVWCLLAKAGLDGDLELIGVEAAEGGAAVTLALKAGDVAIDVSLRRNADGRKRLFAIEGDKGDAELDFSSEPGSASVGGTTLPVEAGFGSPLRRMLRVIGHAFSEGKPLGLHSVEAALPPTRLAVAAALRVRDMQLQMLRRPSGRSADAGRAYAMRELILDLALNAADTRAVLSDAGLTDQNDILRSATDWLNGAAIPDRVANILGGLEQLKTLRSAGIAHW